MAHLFTHVIRRTDGQNIYDQYGFMEADSPEDWTVPDDLDHDDGPVTYQILACTVVNTKTFGEPAEDDE